MFPKNLDEESDDGSNADSDFSGDDAAPNEKKKKKGDKTKGKSAPAKKVAKKESFKDVKAAG